MSENVPGSIYEGIESRMEIFMKINELLKPDNHHIRMIGVTGVSGVGKTTLVKEVSRQAVREGLFDVTATAAVSKAPNLRRIQNQIADCVGLEFGTADLTENEKAKMLYERLKEERKRILIILDDVVEAYLDLKRIGIDYKQNWKIIMTGTNKQVLERMGAEMTFELSILSDDEALLMFKQFNPKADFSSLLSLEIILDHCGGLPLALALLAATTLNYQSVKDWENAMQQLHEPRGGPDGHIFDIVNFRYNAALEEEDKKLMFLLYCTLGEQISSEELLRYSLGLLPGLREITVCEAREVIYRLLDFLCGSHLFLIHDETREEYATRHDVFHDFATSLTSLRFLSSSSNEVPERLELCPELELLCVYDENCSLIIPDNFFQGTNRGLKVLAFNKVQMPRLPSSLLLLLNVETLCLDHCCLGDEIEIAMLGELQSLKVLSLAHTNIKQLPTEIGKLTSLVLLDLSNCSQLKVISPNVLSRLKKLEELLMGNTSVDWEAEGEGSSNSNNNASLEELTQLESLDNLELHVVDPEAITPGFTSRSDRFNITIGGHKSIDECQYRLIFNDRSFRKLTLNMNIVSGGERFGGLWFRLQSLLSVIGELNIEQLHASGSWSVDYVVSRFCFGWRLKHLHVRNNAEIQEVISRADEVMDWGHLQSLALENLSNMIMISQGLSSFCNLKTLKVDNCPKLDYLFQYLTFDNYNYPKLDYLYQYLTLDYLRELEITRCRSLNAIVVTADCDLSVLCSLTLQDLEMLTSIAGDRGETLVSEEVEIQGLKNLKLIKIPKIRKLMAWGRNDNLKILERLEIQECENLWEIFDIDTTLARIEENISFLSELCELQLRNLPTLSSIFTHNFPQRTLNLKMLRQLIVCNCSQLSYLLPYHAAKTLVGIQNIEITNCKMMEKVFPIYGEGLEGDTMNFPVLKSLKLTNLPILTCVSCARVGNLESPLLEELIIVDCPELACSIAYSSKDNGDFKNVLVSSSLEQLNLCQLNHLKEICKDPLASFGNLKYIELHGCDDLKHLFPLPVASSLCLLRELKIISCKMVVQVVENDSSVTTSANVVVFPQVTNLFLEDLPKFISFGSDECMVEWKSLEMLRVIKCPNIKKSTLGKIEKPLFKLVEVEHCQPWQKELKFENISYLFMWFGTDSLATIENLTIESSCDVTKYLGLELQPSSFSQLRKLDARRCENGLNELLSIILQRSYKLECLTIQNCEMMEQVSNLAPLDGDAEGYMYFPQLKEIKLLNLPKLSCIWSKSPRESIAFHKLEYIEMVNCGHEGAMLKNLFSTTVANSLVQLKELKIHSCKKIEEIIFKNSKQTEILLPELERLELVSLPNVRKFNSEDIKVKFPKLLSLTIDNCPKMDAFSPGFLSTTPSISEGTSQLVVDEKMVCSNLLSLYGMFGRGKN